MDTAAYAHADQQRHLSISGRVLRPFVFLLFMLGSLMAFAQFTPVKITQYGTYAGTNGGFNYLPDVFLEISGPHSFDESVTAPGSGAESATTRRQGSIASNQVWLKATTGTTSRSSTSAGLWYDFNVSSRHIQLDYILALNQLVWWDNVIVKVSDMTSSIVLIDKQTVTESGTVYLDVVPGHKIQLYVGINQNNLNGFSYPAGDTAFRAEGTVTPYFMAANLNINSTNPSTGAPITVYNKDHNNQGNGVTPFTRVYDTGESTSVNAPATLAGGTKAFDHWEKDGTPVGSARTLTVPLDGDHTINAVYADSFTLNVTSANPATGVPITVYQADANGLKNGTTSFTRTYKTGTNVALTAPISIGANRFIRWERDSVSMGVSRTVSVSMTAAHTMNAVYSPVNELQVNSENPPSGVPVTVYTADVNGAKNGTTAFTRTYPAGTNASMTAPATAAGNYFYRWMVDGVQATTARTVTVAMNAAHSAAAVYLPGQTLTVNSTGVSNVSITVWKKDINGAQNGVTMFTRLFWQGLAVGLTAPATSGGKSFVRWEVDGVSQGAAKTITVTMGANHSATAIYN